VNHGSMTASHFQAGTKLLHAARDERETEVRLVPRLDLLLNEIGNEEVAEDYELNP